MTNPLTLEDRVTKLEAKEQSSEKNRGFLIALFLALITTGIAGAGTLVTTNRTAEQNQQTIQAVDQRQRQIQTTLTRIVERQENTREMLLRIEHALPEGPRR